MRDITFIEQGRGRGDLTTGNVSQTNSPPPWMHLRACQPALIPALSAHLPRISTHTPPPIQASDPIRKDKTMAYSKASKSKARKLGYGSILLALLLLTAVTLAISADDRKVETIDATATGTSTQLGKIVSVKVTIYEFSTDEDRQILIDAFKKGQNQGLVNALTKMKAVGRIAITGTLGYDLSYIRLVPTDTGRKIRFVTNRLLRFGEVYANTQTTAYNLTAGEFDLNDKDKNKSSGVLYPAAQLVINKEGQLEFQLNKNPWKLVNIIDWNQAGVPK
jgi:hypothetical protein